MNGPPGAPGTGSGADGGGPAATFAVKAYGAFCDAAHDDTTAIQSAEKAREAAMGGVLSFPNGICVVSSAIVVNVGGIVLGSGHGLTGAIQMATVLRTTSTTDDVFRVTTVDGISFRELQIDAPGVTKMSGAGIKIQPTQPPYGANVNRQARIDSVTINNMDDGIELYNAANFSVTNSFITDFQNNGIYVNQNSVIVDAGDSLVSGNTIWDFNVNSGAAGLRLDPAGGMEVVGNKFLSARFGLWLTVSQGPTGTINFSNNSVEQQTVSGFYVEQAAAGKTYGNIVVTSNEFSILKVAGAQSGVTFVAGASGSYISNAVVANNVFNMSLAQGAIIDINDGTGVTLSGNVLNNLGVAGSVGIATGGNASNVLVFGNVFQGLPSGSYGTLNGGTTLKF
jgi:hypothetical protein